MDPLFTDENSPASAAAAWAPTPRRPAGRFPWLAKLAALGAVFLALMWALGSVTDIVREREQRLGEAEASVADGLSGDQTLLGPVLQRLCEERWDVVQGEGKDRRVVTEKREFVLRSAPTSLDVQARSEITPRSRGIFQVNTYLFRSTAEAEWKDGAALQPRAEHAGGRLRCDPVRVVMAVGDARGIRLASLKANDQVLSALPGTGDASHAQGFQAILPETLSEGSAPLRLSLALDLVGTGALGFAPVSERTRISLTSDWPHPSFAGRFLPVSRDVGESGFTARWQLSALATAAPQAWLAGKRLCSFHEGPVVSSTDPSACIDTFGVRFMDPVNVYSLSDRATKYGILFIGLCFVGVAMVEVLKRVRVHPVQYLLVGAGLSVFFLLLVSLGEHLSFALAYLIASSASCVLLGFYGSFVLRGVRAGLVFAAGIATMFGALYGLLLMEQAALLLGSLLLFLVLAAVMVATRRVDWYALMAQMGRETGPQAPAGRNP